MRNFERPARRRRSRAVFARTIGIDHSGPETPTSILKGFASIGPKATSPVELSIRRRPARPYGSRKEIAEWLMVRLADDVPMLAAPSIRNQGGRS
jgi:hypothetical protein